MDTREWISEVYDAVFAIGNSVNSCDISDLRKLLTESANLSFRYVYCPVVLFTVSIIIMMDVVILVKRRKSNEYYTITTNGRTIYQSF
jgi:hypothetical protein